VPIRLTYERWFHITENHDDLASYYFEVLETVEEPELIVRGNKGSLKAVKSLGKNNWLVVVYKEISMINKGEIQRAEKTTVSLHVPEKDVVSIAVTDIMGRVVVREKRVLDKGQHFFRLDPGSGNILFFNASWQGQHSSIKVLQTNSLSGHTTRLEYIGYETSSPQLKACKDVQSFQFSLGDELLYIGYHDSLQSGMTDIPESNDTLTFQFATNIPCPGTPTVEYEGQLYNTIQIFSQCWLKENLNVGTMIPGLQYMSDNGILEKYCYNNEPDSCTKYGGLYQWNEMMQYTDQAGTQGICPPGWHLPTDEDWKVLEGAVDSQYGIGDAQWNIMDYRGYDVAKNLKTTSGWSYNGNGTDLFGFSGLPGGSYFFNSGSFSSASSNGVWWTSKGGVSGRAYRRHFFCIFPEANREYHFKNYGYSVRCINDKQ